jgi:hypothetical protein
MTPQGQEEESDQLPEEQPSSAVTEDDADVERDESEKNEGGADDDGDGGSGQATGNPANAG